MSLDPAFSDIYLPTSDFKTIGERINTISTAPVCNFVSGICSYDMKCDKVNQANISMQIDVGVDEPVYIPFQHMYVDKLENGVENCHIPIVRQSIDSNLWIMGQVFFKNHYTVFDMTHADDTSASSPYHLIGVNFKRTIFAPKKEE